VLATLFFAFQIYCDFSGYSDIAIGCARIMGFKLMTNFNRPYLSSNISEFWTRWHISLSTWFKDYLYISLGGNRVSIPRWYFNLFFVFLVSGLWHGANWTFLIWGGLNGCYLILALIRQRVWKKMGWGKISLPPFLGKVISLSTTFILICFSWIFFRANSLHDSFLIVRKIFTFKGPIFNNNTPSLFFSFIGIAILIGAELKQEYWKGSFSLFNNPSPVVRYLSYVTIILIILLIGVFDGGQFIYFQF
jgi:D-alanyl-lipoteichoic acid acyltransferase DltB (MBOAT superfamily)